MKTHAELMDSSSNPLNPFASDAPLNFDGVAPGRMWIVEKRFVKKLYARSCFVPEDIRCVWVELKPEYWARRGDVTE